MMTIQSISQRIRESSVLNVVAFWLWMTFLLQRRDLS